MPRNIRAVLICCVLGLVSLAGQPASAIQTSREGNVNPTSLTTALVNARTLADQVSVSAQMAGYHVQAPKPFTARDPLAVILDASTQARALQKVALSGMTSSRWITANRATQIAPYAVVVPKNTPAHLDRAKWPLIRAGIDAVAPIDRGRMWQATEILAAGIDAALALKPAMEKKLAKLQTPLGPVVIDNRDPAAGNCDDTYDTAIFLIIDACGNDTYTGSAGSADARNAVPISIVINTGGSPTITPVGIPTSGVGSFGGIALFVDTVGGEVIGSPNQPCNDIFLLGGQDGSVAGVGTAGGVGIFADTSATGDDVRCVTGFGTPKFGAGLLGGAGVLLDQGGNDVYGGDTFEQGSGWFGDAFGLLFDSGGTNSYFDFSTFSQGSGGVGGAGILIQAGSGNDSFKGLSQLTQGAGGCGGVGLLIDLGGNDTFEDTADSTQGSSNSLGCADENGNSLIDHAVSILPPAAQNLVQRLPYSIVDGLFGSVGTSSIGVLAASGGDDTFTGGSLTQGSHYGNGVGLLLKDGGNDTYNAFDCAQGFGDSGVPAVSSCQAPAPPLVPTNGLPWGGVAALIDSSGNDTYNLSLGANGQGEGFGNSFVALIDTGGVDTYSSGIVDDGGPQPRGTTGIAIDRNLR